MKRGLFGMFLGVLLFLVCLSVQAQTPAAGYHLVGTVSLKVPVTRMKMTNLVFPIAVETGVKVSSDVQVQQPRGITNVIQLKAARRNFTPTNLTVFGKDGRLYSFDLVYVEDTAVLDYRVVVDGLGTPDHVVKLSGLPVDQATLDTDAVFLSNKRGFLDRSVGSGGMRLRLRGIWLRDGLLWFCLRVTDRTQVSFAPSYLRIYVSDSKRVRRTASQEAPLTPVYTGGLSPVPGDSSRELVVGLPPLTVARRKKLVIALADADGGRVLLLEIKGKIVLRARRG